MTATRRVFAAVVVAIVAVAGAGAVTAASRTSPAHVAMTRAAPPPTTTSSTARATTTAPAPPPPPDPVAATVKDIEAFVSRARGLAFKADVKVTVLDDVAFRSRVVGSNTPTQADRDRAKAFEGMLRAFGLLNAPVDLIQGTQTLVGDSVVGFYDDKTKELVVRGRSLTPYVRETMAHELTHALQDQSFGLDRKIDDSEASAAFTALVEGDAVRIERAYLASLSPAEKAQAAEEARRLSSQVTTGPQVPDVLEASFAFPYEFGPPLVDAVLKAGGQPRLDAAFGKPPLSTEQVMHPDHFLAGDGPKAVAAPPADGKVVDSGTVGEADLQLMLRARLPANQARVAADGWGGDKYVAWTDGSRTCVRASFVMDTPADTQQLVSALQAWAAGHTATVAGSGPVVLTSCAS